MGGKTSFIISKLKILTHQKFFINQKSIYNLEVKKQIYKLKNKPKIKHTRTKNKNFSNQNHPTFTHLDRPEGVERSHRKIKAKDKVGIQKIINQKFSKKLKTKTLVIKKSTLLPISTDQREWRDLIEKLRQNVK